MMEPGQCPSPATTVLPEANKTPAFPLVKPPERSAEVPWSEKCSEALIIAAMSAAPDHWQVIVPPLQKYAKDELYGKFSDILHGQAVNSFGPRDLGPCSEFT
jgi:hypothetical protein